MEVRRVCGIPAACLTCELYMACCADPYSLKVKALGDLQELPAMLQT